MKEEKKHKIFNYYMDFSFIIKYNKFKNYG